ncbi:MAG TPA: hypothetical protein VMP01_16325 [Pirellulaceae bacterium]|nr:hypothetical protein [Pirellulaceae bacterium]
MGLSFHCPHCTQAVGALPTQMGQQVTCAACGAQFRLSPMLLGGNGRSAAAKTPPVATAAVAKPAAPPIAAPIATAMPPAAAPAPPPPVATVVKMPPRPTPTASSPPVAAPVAPTTHHSPLTTHHSPAAQQPNVARFIAAASQDSTVQLTADGKLPELSLAEATAKKQKPTESNTSPLVLGLALVASTVMSILLLVADFGGGGTSTETADQARAAMASYYEDQEGPLLPYQQFLKDASLAHSLGKFDEERECYRRVLHLYRSEAKNQYVGLTGTKSSDKELLNLLGIVLDEGSR